MSQFIGIRVQLLLTDGQTVRGVVSAAQSGGLVVDGMAVAAAAIKDLTVLSTTVNTSDTTPNTSQSTQINHAQFKDPAIVSMARPHRIQTATTAKPIDSQPFQRHIVAIPFDNKEDSPSSTQQTQTKLKKPSTPKQRKHESSSSPQQKHQHQPQHHQQPKKQPKSATRPKPALSKNNTTPNTNASISVENTVDLSQDFDFQSSLERFDKQKVFAEIRRSEEQVLEAGGGMSGFHGKDRIGVREMVLTESGGETGNDAEAETDEELDDDDDTDFFFEGDEVDYNHAFLDAPEFVIRGGGGSRSGSGGAGSGLRSKRPTFKSITGVQVPGITPVEMAEVERLAITETGPNETQMIENGGRSAAMLALQILGGARRINQTNHNTPPCVVVLAGNNRTGAYGLCAARHLANHQVRVIAHVVGAEAELTNTVSYQRKILLPTGARVVRATALYTSGGGKLEQDVVVGETSDLVIDALLGSSQRLLDLPHESDRVAASLLMEWTRGGNGGGGGGSTTSSSIYNSHKHAATLPPNQSLSPSPRRVLSLDIPSGFNPVTGFSADACVHAKWTLAFGLPKACLARIARESGGAACGELFLADVGIPKILYDRLKVSHIDGSEEVGYGDIGGGSGRGGGEGSLKRISRQPVRYVPPFGDKYIVGLIVE